MQFKRLFILLLVLPIFSLFVKSQYPNVVIETTMGTLKIKLYDSTIRHSDNFVKLVNEGYYDGQLFHRVINNFMIQSGDDKSISAQPGDRLGNGGKTYTIPSEFYPDYYHKKGALAAARTGDNVNPQKESSGSQFYIVQGQVFTKEQLDMFVNRNVHIPFTQQQIDTYLTVGGTPHLDYSYTVFGEVIDGLNIVDSIAKVQTDRLNRPVQDIKIVKMYTIQ